MIFTKKEKEIITKNNIIKSNVETWVNQNTGEIVEATEITKKIGRNGFMITYLSTIIELMESLGTKKMQVVKYILENMEKSNNSLIITTRELSEKSNVGHNTVLETLKILEKANIITRRIGAIMISPHLVHKGNENKERALMTRFQEFSDTE